VEGGVGEGERRREGLLASDWEEKGAGRLGAEGLWVSIKEGAGGEV